MLSAYQNAVFDWAKECFNEEILNDPIERGKRMVEEALELGQAVGLDKNHCLALVDYVFSRPKGDVGQEVAGVMVTTLVLSSVLGVSASYELGKEHNRIRQPEIMDKIRKKQVSKQLIGRENEFKEKESGNILKEAEAVIYGDREKTYGTPDKNLKNIAKVWEVILGIPLTTDQVNLCMIGVKLARLVNDPTHHDSQVDICGYAALMERIQKLNQKEVTNERNQREETGNTG